MKKEHESFQQIILSTSFYQYLISLETVISSANKRNAIFKSFTAQFLNKLRVILSTYLFIVDGVENALLRVFHRNGMPLSFSPEWYASELV